MPPQWSNPDGRPPPGTLVHHVLVIGPETCDDRKVVVETLERYTVRMEAVHLHTVFEGVAVRKTDAGEWERCGVSFYAKTWAEKEWWPRSCNNVRWWGPTERAWARMMTDVLNAVWQTPKLGRHCLVFRDGEDTRTEALLTAVRGRFHPKRFKIIRC